MPPLLPDNPLFAPYRDSILATAKPCAHIHLTACDALTLWQSKLGGLPYWPQDAAYPHDPQGRPLHLLAQINFADVPPLSDFPRRGILQFFISPYFTRTSFWGMNLQEPDVQSAFRVCYWPEVTDDPAALRQDFGFLPALPIEPPPALGLKEKFLRLFKKSDDLLLSSPAPCASAQVNS